VIRSLGLAPLVLGWTVVAAALVPARAQIEFPPPQGKGRVAVVVSGHAGAARYEFVAAQIAQLGYDAVLFDANDVKGRSGGPLVDNLEDAGLRAAIRQAQQAPHAVPGRVALVGFSQGGGQVLFYGSQMPDAAAVVIAWYPATRFISDVSGFVSRLKLPVLMFAGEKDYYGNCCVVGTARALAAAAAGRSFELVVYPEVKHDFIYGGLNYNAEAYANAMQRTAAKLAQYLGR
jgi:dienelactone hydrolase